MKLLCSLGFHSWKLGPTGETRYSKGGILAGSVERRSRACSRCASSQELYRFGSFMRLYTDDTGWKVIELPEIAACIENDYLPMAELTAFNLKKNVAKVEAVDGTNCQCGRPWKRVKSDHQWEWWHSHWCRYCLRYSGVWYKERKSDAELARLRRR